MAFSIPPVVADILRVAAPTLLGAIGGPLGAIAATVVSAALREFTSSPPTGVGPQPATGGPATPGLIVQAVQEHSDDPRLLLALREAEIALQRYEMELKFRFADLEQKDRQSARTATVESGLAHPQFMFGMGVVVLSMLMLFGVVAGCVMALTGKLTIDPASTNIAIAAFGLLGTVTGVFQAVSSQILAFYFGSSAGSSAKTDQMTATMRDMGQALGDAAKAAPVAVPPPTVVVAPPPAVPASDDTPAPAPETPAGTNGTGGNWRRYAQGKVAWMLTPDGVLIENESAPGRTVGEPTTVRRIWKDFGPMVAASCAVHGVPLELAVACIATESRGIPKAVLNEPDGRSSVGLMQVLLGTAAEVMGRDVTRAELQDPTFGIEAGVRYMAKKRPETGYDPPLAGAAHNAGGVYPARAQDQNRWGLRSTGDHVDRFVLYFNDAVAVAKMEGWSHQAAEWASVQSAGPPAPR